MTLRDIARHCGVSISTVSRVLRQDDPKAASPATRQRILAAAQQLGYAPNLAARAVQKGQPAASTPPSVTLVLGQIDNLENNDFFRTLLESCSATMIKLGIALSPPVAVEDVLAASASPAHRGLVLLGRCSVARQRALARRAALVCVGLNDFSPQYDQVICPGDQAARAAIAYLWAQGHTRIGYVGEKDNERRYFAYADLMRAHGAPPQVYIAVQNTQGGRQAAVRYLADERRPTAVFCANDSTAIGFLQQLRAAQAPLPAIVSIDDIPAAQSIAPRLTTVHIPADEMGAMAIRLVTDRLQGGHHEPVRVSFPFRLVRRESS